MEHAGDLARGEIFHIAEKQHDAICPRNGRQSASDLCPPARVFRLLLRIGPLINSRVALGASHGLERLKVGGLVRPLATTHETSIPDDAIEPGTKRTGVANLTSAAIRLDQRLLQGILGIRLVATHGQAEPARDVLGAPEKPIHGRLIAVRGCADKRRVVFPHVGRCHLSHGF